MGCNITVVDKKLALAKLILLFRGREYIYMSLTRSLFVAL